MLIGNKLIYILYQVQLDIYETFWNDRNGFSHSFKTYHELFQKGGNKNLCLIFLSNPINLKFLSFHLYPKVPKLCN